MDWESLLRSHGIDPDDLEAGDEIDLRSESVERRSSKHQIGVQQSDENLSAGERSFLDAWSRYGDPSYRLVRQFKFHAERRWRADFAFPDQHVLVEIEGMFSADAHSGRHRSVYGYMADCEKYNGALLCGYVVYRIPTVWLSDRSGRAGAICNDLLTLLKSRNGSCA